MVPEEKIASPSGRRHPAALLAAALLSWVLAACATPAPPPRPPAGQREFFIPAVDEELFGTWVLDDPGPPGAAARLLIYSWGLVESFAEITDTALGWRGTLIIDLAWSDEQGNRWFREYRRGSGDNLYNGNAFVLDRVSADGQVLESVFSRSGWPEAAELDPAANPTYLRYRRRE
jgi:hypothetical protein